MSIQCSICNSTIKAPGTAWYACTRFSFRTSYICEPCLDTVPQHLRHPTAELRQFDFTFGPLKADVSYPSDRLQSYGSEQLAPRFWVETTDLTNLFSEKLPFFSMIYPYYDFDYYLKDIVTWHREGRYKDDDTFANDLRWLIIFGHAIEAYLNRLDGIEAEPARKLLSPYDVPKPATDPRQLQQARELFDEVIRRFTPN